MKVRDCPQCAIYCADVHLAVEEKQGIEDKTQTNLINLRRVIYLTIMNALNYEEAVHKLLKVQIKEGQEVRSLLPLLYKTLICVCRLSSAR